MCRPTSVSVLALCVLGSWLGAPRVAGAGASADAAPGELFAEVAGQVGLDFVHWNGMTGELYYSEVLGSGAALFDYDNDGDLDVYLVQGALLAPGETLADALVAPDRPPLIRDRLYRNDLEILHGGSRRLRFVDVTEESGLDARGYGMGVATGDFDNDGWIDLYVTNLGSNQLWRNNGAGTGGRVTFSDVTAESGSGDERWSTSAAAADFDRDGWLDLYVANNVDFSAASHKPCYDASSARDYCGPQSYRAVPDRLLRNLGGDPSPGPRGGIRFEDVTARAGVAGAYGPGLGVVAADFDRDGWPDFYVANDAAENQLWHGAGGAGFEDLGLLSGSALNLVGQTEASMGIGADDFDGDGDVDLFLTHLAGETNTLYRNDGAGNFEDLTLTAGLALPSVPFTSFGTGWLDLDNDGELDLLVVSGAIKHLPELMRAGDPLPLRQPNQLFRNLGPDAGGAVRFADVTAGAGAAFELLEVSRGAAFGDVDNDGDTDVLVTNNGGPARLLLNRGNPKNHWLGLRLVAGKPARDMLGAEVTSRRPGRSPLYRRAHTDGSYCSASDPRVLVGLGPSAAPATVQVFWPDGTREEYAGLAVDRYTTLRWGSGHPLTTASEAVSRQVDLGGPPSPMPAPVEVEPAIDLTADLEPLPAPAYDRLETAVRDQLEAQRRTLAALESEPAARLAAAFGATGRVHHAYQLYDVAAASYRNAQRLAPGEPTWPYLLAHVYLAVGDAERAAASFSRVLELDPGQPAARLGRARSLLELGRLGAAEEILAALVAVAPDFAAAHAVRGQVALARRDFSAAARHLEAALKLQPAATELYDSLANAYRGLGDGVRAAAQLARRGNGTVAVPDPLLRDLETLIRGSKHHLQAGQDAYAEGRYSEAAAAFRRALGERPDDVAARVNLGSALARLGNTAAAIAAFREALTREPRQANAHFNLGTLLAEHGDVEAAIRHYLAAIDVDSGLTDAYFNLANVLRRTRRCAEAVEHYRRVADLDPVRTTAWLGEVMCLAELSRFAEARSRAEAGHRSFPGDLPLTDALARLLAASPDAELRDGPRALALAQEDFAAARTFDHVVTLAMAHAEAGDFERAVKWQQRAIEVAQRAGHPEVAAALEAVLQGYARGEPSRRPWP